MLRPLLGLALVLCACSSAPVEPSFSPEPRPPTLRFQYDPQASPAGGAARFEDWDRRFGLSVHGSLLDDYEGDASGPSQGLSGDLDASLLGLQLDLLLPRSAFLIAVERREYERADSRELVVGGRYLFLEGRLRPYVEGRGRYGLGLEPRGAGDSDPFLGLGAGVGTLFRLTPRVHLDARLLYESTLGEVDLDGGGDVRLDGWMGTLGIGITL